MTRLLIVDDALFMRAQIKNFVKDKGFEIVGEAENGEIGVKRYVELQPDLVTMDITMPIMNGIEATIAIKKFNPLAKILVISAMGQETMVREAITAGAKGFIVKPFKEDHLIATLNKIVAS